MIFKKVLIVYALFARPPRHLKLCGAYVTVSFAADTAQSWKLLRRIRHVPGDAPQQKYW